MSDTAARYCYPAFKVFIFGIEVTKDVTSINVTSHDGAAPNTCQITMLNELDKYIMTTADIVAINKLSFTNNQLDIPWMSGKTLNPNDLNSGVGGLLEVGSEAFASAVNTGITSDIKRKVLLKKNQVVQDVDKDTIVDIFGHKIQATKFANYYGSAIHRYPFADGSPIFHPMDPIRVFMRDPLNPGRWYHHFTGFVSDMVDNVDHNNVKTFTIVVEDPTKLFRYTRIFINPGILDAKSIIQKGDLKVQSFYSHFMKGFNLPEVFFTLMFGPDKVKAEKLIEKSHGAS